MAQKDRSVKRIDEHSDNLRTGGGQLLTPATDNIVAPHLPSVPEPEDVTIGTETLLRTTLVPKVLLEVTWNPPSVLIPELYEIQAAKDSAFTTGLLRFNSTIDSAVLELNTNTDYWIRVRAIVRGLYGEWGYPSNYPTVSVHTIGDTTPPDEVTGQATDWTSDDLEFTWTNPSSDNFFDTRLRIYNANPSSGGTLYKEVYVPGSPGGNSRYVFRLADNNQVTAGNPLTTVYYTLFARSLAHILSATGVSGTVTKTRPTKPTNLTTSWDSDDGTFDETVTFAWDEVAGATGYRLIIDGAIKDTPRIQYTYTRSENIADHAPVLVSGDYALSYTVQAYNGLRQFSGGASGTATNLAPSSSNLTLNYVPGFSSLYAYVTPTTEIKDLYGYRWTLKSGGVNVQTTLSFTPEVTFTTLNGVYSLEIYAIDLFGRKSTTISGVGITLDGLTIDQLRSETKYTNSIGTSPTTLDGLKDNNLLTSVVTIASGTSWKWTKAERPLLDRYRTITLAVSGAATNWPSVYYGLSTDDSTYRWFAGPLVATGSTGQSTTLTEHASETIAQASGVLLSTNINRFDLPSVLEARYIKMGHRGNTHNLAEYYPRRLLQSDDIEAETIKGINIAAATITADKISVVSLAAITIWTGALTVSGVISIHTSGGIYQGTGTFSSPTTGLKIYNSSGVGKISGYNSGLEQITLDTDGKLKAGNGNVVLSSGGLTIATITAGSQIGQSIRFMDGGSFTADIFAVLTSTEKSLSLRTGNSQFNDIGTGIEILHNPGGSTGSAVNIDAVTSPSSIGLTAEDIAVTGDITTLGNLTLLAGDIDISGTVTSNGGMFPGDNGLAYDTQLIASIANNGIAAIDVSVTNPAIILLYGGGIAAMYVTNGSTHTTVEMSDPSGGYTNAAGGAASINVYWSAGNSRYELENKRGSTIAVRIWILQS